MDELLNSREWAIATLVALGVFAALTMPKVRHQVPGLLRMLVQRAIAVPLLALACWVALVVLVAARIGVWNDGFLKDTLVWFVVSAFGTVFAALKAAKTDNYFRRAGMQALAAAVLLQYAMNLYTFNYFLELLLQDSLLLLQDSLLLLGALPVVAQSDSKYGPAEKLFRVTIVIVVSLVLALTARGLSHTWGELHMRQVLLGLALSIWLPLAVLPFIWSLALYMSYEVVLTRMHIPVFGLRAPTRTRLALVMTLGLDLRAVNDLPSQPDDMRAIASARRWRDVREAVRVYRRRRDRRRTATELASARLTRLAGLRGVDVHGRQRDQRVRGHEKVPAGGQ